ncbi:hypothetical protein [Ruminococcus sp.]|uniref:hypothetical protein n=1 Tax=Ruminococcus sp. TaxID=41978 RepID=UPI0025E48F27|nr:hypothetical protein [Ruminococcus sp.]
MRKNYIVPLVMSTLLFSSCTKGITDDRTNDTTVTTTDVTTTAEAETTTSTTETSATTNTRSTTTAKTTSTTTTTAASTSATTTTEKTTEAPTEPATEPDPDAEDKKLLKAINELKDNYKYFYLNHQPDGTLTHYTPDGELVDYKNLENYMVYEAGTIPIDRVLGSITDEQDVIAKAREVLLKGNGQEYMDWLEKEPASSDGTRYIRENPPIVATYYEDYDTWYIYPTSPSWKREDGKGGVVAWSEGPSFMCIRGSDGKLLGTCIKY